MLVASRHWQHTISAAAALIGETPPNISRCPVDLQLLMCVNNLPKVPGRLVCATELTCRMGSHDNISCHPAERIFPPLSQPKLVGLLDLATLARLS